MKMKHIKTEAAPVSGQQLYAVLYDGDTATGTPPTWQIWTQEQMEQPDSRVLEHYPIVNSQQYRTRDCHEELVRALQAVVEYWDKSERQSYEAAMINVCHLATQARAALNKASR